MGKRQREKGAAWEREVAQRLRAVFPGAKRGIGQCRSAGEVADVDIPLFWVEAKVGKHTFPRKALEQARVAAPRGRIALAITKDDRRPPMASMSLEDFEWFLRQWLDALRRAGAQDFPLERLEAPPSQPLPAVEPLRGPWGEP